MKTTMNCMYFGFITVHPEIMNLQLLIWEQSEENSMYEQLITYPVYVKITLFLIAVFLLMCLHYRSKSTNRRKSIFYDLQRISFQLENSKTDLHSETFDTLSILNKEISQQFSDEDRQFSLFLCLILLLFFFSISIVHLYANV